MEPSPAQRGLGFASFMIGDFARGRLEGETILISPKDSAEKAKPRLQAGSKAVGQTRPAATGRAAKAAALPGMMGCGAGDGDGPLPGHALCVPPDTRPRMSLSQARSEALLNPNSDPRTATAGLWAGQCLAPARVSLGPATGIKGSPGMAVCHSNPWKDQPPFQPGCTKGT